MRGFKERNTAKALAKNPHRTILTIERLQPRADSESSFSKLPREIRDQIYDHVWKYTPKIRQWYKQKQYDVTFDVEQNKAADDLSYDEASWLLTNKQMLHEGIQQLHQKFLMALQEQRRDYEVPVLHLSPDDSYTGANA